MNTVNFTVNIGSVDVGTESFLKGNTYARSFSGTDLATVLAWGVAGYVTVNSNVIEQDIGTLGTDASGVTIDRAFVAHFSLTAAQATAVDTDGILAAVTDTGAQQVITTGITQPNVPRNITATAGGTAASIKAIQVIVAGTDANGTAITETLPVFTENTAGTVVGSKAFKTITSITIPAHDAITATTAIGFGEKLGLPFKLAQAAPLIAYVGGTKETTLPTITASSSALSSNTVTFDTDLAGAAVDVFFLV